MNSILSLFHQVESEETASAINVCSGIKTACDVIENISVYQILIGETVVNKDMIEVVNSRLWSTYYSSKRDQYQHPQDVALTIYLYILGYADRELAEYAAGIMSGDDRLFWARALANNKKLLCRIRGGKIVWG